MLTVDTMTTLILMIDDQNTDLVVVMGLRGVVHMEDLQEEDHMNLE